MFSKYNVPLEYIYIFKSISKYHKNCDVLKCFMSNCRFGALPYAIIKCETGAQMFVDINANTFDRVSQICSHCFNTLTKEEQKEIRDVLK